MDAETDHGHTLTDETNEKQVVDIAAIMRAIPHRYPFLLIDRVVDLIKNVSAIGIKNVSIIESMAQTAAVLVVETLGTDARGKVVYFMSVEGAKFRRPVGPGDQVHVHVVKLRNRRNVWKFHAIARVDGASVAEATFAAMIMDRTGS
jgi:3-hydroxyacyl-[acyl-carrier-protein] dehydratase